MNEVTEPLQPVLAASLSWFELATRHRASIAGLVVLAFPLIMPFTALAVNILIYGLYALGFNLVYGYLGLLSFGHAALFGTGAYLCGIAIVHFGLPWYSRSRSALPRASSMAALIGVLAIRTRGIYFAMVTMALSQCVYYLFYQAVDWTGGENGLRGINVRTVDILRPQARLHQPADPLLCHRSVRNRGVLRVVADSRFAIRRGHRGGARERDPGQGVRL